MNSGQSSPKQYSTLQNASYGIIMKDETDLDLYDNKMDPMNQLLPSGYSGYDESMMVDMVTGAVVSSHISIIFMKSIHYQVFNFRWILCNSQRPLRFQVVPNTLCSKAFQMQLTYHRFCKDCPVKNKRITMTLLVITSIVRELSRRSCR